MPELLTRPEQPIFVDDEGGRGRRLRLLGWGLAILAALWLVALLAGAAGVGRLPGIPLPPVGALDRAGTAEPRESRAVTRRPAPSVPASPLAPLSTAPAARRAEGRRASTAPRRGSRPEPRERRAPAATPQTNAGAPATGPAADAPAATTPAPPAATPVRKPRGRDTTSAATPGPQRGRPAPIASATPAPTPDGGRGPSATGEQRSSEAPGRTRTTP